MSACECACVCVCVRVRVVGGCIRAVKDRLVYSRKADQKKKERETSTFTRTQRKNITPIACQICTSKKQPSDSQGWGICIVQCFGQDLGDSRKRVLSTKKVRVIEVKKDLFHFYSLSADHSYDLYHIHFTSWSGYKLPPLFNFSVCFRDFHN